MEQEKKPTTKKPKEKIPFKQKLKNGWKWTRENLLNKETLFFTLIGELIFWSPVIVCAILGLIVDAKYWAVVGSIVAFWTLPLTPGWAIQIALIFGLKKLFHKAFLRREQTKKDKKAKALEDKQNVDDNTDDVSKSANGTDTSSSDANAN